MLEVLGWRAKSPMCLCAGVCVICCKKYSFLVDKLEYHGIVLYCKQSSFLGDNTLLDKTGKSHNFGTDFDVYGVAFPI